MKRICFFLAAAAGIVSCVKENAIVPEQNGGNRVTIKAVSADTRTTIDDSGVLWENGDAIGVVFKGEDANYIENFTTSLESSSSSAVFTAELSTDLAADATIGKYGYAIYPNSSVVLENGIISISHELPEIQTGSIESGRNLSYALVNTAKIQNNEATEAAFTNALTLLKVIVPAGVKSVALTASSTSADLVGKASFTATVSESQETVTLVKTSTTSKRSVTLENGDELTEGANYILVYPGTARELTLTMTGTDGAVYENTLNNITFAEGTFRTINLTEIFKLDVEDTEYVSPAGGTFEVPVVSTADYEYTISIGGNPTWLSHAETKAFTGKTIVFNVEQNTTGTTRTAEITISWGDSQSKTFTVSQSSIDMSIVYVDPSAEEKEYIQWEESFGYFSDAELKTPVLANETPVTYTNTFEIQLSDDFTKGTYKIVNMFVYNNAYTGQTGGTYYADFADGILTVYTSTSTDKSYYFANDILLLDYDSANKTFTSKNSIRFAYKFDNKDLPNGGYIGNYIVKVKEAEDNAGGEEEINPLVAGVIGQYTENWYSSQYVTKGTLKIDYSNDLSKGDVLVTFGFADAPIYGTVSTDAYGYTTITASGSTTALGPITASLTCPTDYIYGSVSYYDGSSTISDYSASRIK